MVCKPESGTGVPTDYDGVGMDKEGNVVGYWFIDGTEPDNDGWYVDLDGTPRGTWSYDEGTTLSGTWTHSDGSESGTWMASEDDPTTFIDSTPEEVCSDQDLGLVGSDGNGCEKYYEAGWDQECGLLDSNNF